VLAVYEFRTVFVSAAVLYAVTRLIDLDRAALWSVVDVFVLGAVVVAGYGLYQLVTSDGSGLITTAEGVARIRSVYGSPNNLALYLGRALPIALAVALLARGAPGWRRVAYGGAGLVLLTAMVLTFSRGALVLGLPAALAVLVIGWQGRRGWVVVGAALAFGLLAIPLLLQIPRFAGMFDFDSGTGFFRVNLWLSAVEMARDHFWVGVGPDNFLYAYRGVYIRPEAWQEPNLSHPHNLVLDALTRVGLPGLIVLVSLFVAFWRTGLRAVHANPDDAPERALAIGLLAAGAHMLAHGLVDHSFFLVDLAGVFMLLLALGAKLGKDTS
jgi:O-antigen ligase